MKKLNGLTRWCAAIVTSTIACDQGLAMNLRPAGADATPTKTFRISEGVQAGDFWALPGLANTPSAEQLKTDIGEMCGDPVNPFQTWGDWGIYYGDMWAGIEFLRFTLQSNANGQTHNGIDNKETRLKLYRDLTKILKEKNIEIPQKALEQEEANALVAKLRSHREAGFGEARDATADESYILEALHAETPEAIAAVVRQIRGLRDVQGRRGWEHYANLAPIQVHLVATETLNRILLTAGEANLQAMVGANAWTQLATVGQRILLGLGALVTIANNASIGRTTSYAKCLTTAIGHEIANIIRTRAGDQSIEDLYNSIIAAGAPDAPHDHAHWLTEAEINELGSSKTLGVQLLDKSTVNLMARFILGIPQAEDLTAGNWVAGNNDAWNNTNGAGQGKLAIIQGSLGLINASNTDFYKALRDSILECMRA